MPGHRTIGFSDPYLSSDRDSIAVDERRVRKYWIGHEMSLMRNTPQPPTFSLDRDGRKWHHCGFCLFLMKSNPLLLNFFFVLIVDDINQKTSSDWAGSSVNVLSLVALKKDELTTVVQKMPHLPQDPQLIQQLTPRDLLLPRFSIVLISTRVSSLNLDIILV